MKKRVLTGMSGGVDSSVTAALLMEAGYEVTGATMKLFGNEDITSCAQGQTCCALSDTEDARSVCMKLGIDHMVFDFREDFRRDVMEKFAESYRKGLTPNPCIDCNNFVKFPLLLRRARQLDFDYIATGHYARIDYDENAGRYMLRRAVDRNKDQSYVLYGLTQEELSGTLLPLGTYEKPQVRQEADRLELVNAQKPESQDICFVPDGDYGAFLEKNMGIISKPGDVLDTEGHVLGQHQGIINYTIGQRRGLGMAFPGKRYVVDKSAERATVTIGEERDLYRDRFHVTNLNLISISKLTCPVEAAVMTRYRDRETACVLHPAHGGALVRLKEPKRAVTPGQAAVFYIGDTVLGGGVISESGEFGCGGQ